MNSRISLEKQIRDMGSQELIELVENNKKYHSWICNCYEFAKTLNHRNMSILDVPYEVQSKYYLNSISEKDEDICYLICKNYFQLTKKDIINDLTAI